MPTLLLELFCEEIPARMQSAALRELEKRMADGLHAARLASDSLDGFVTPRRLAVRVAGLPEQQPDVSSERKGPKVGAPEQAIEGFCRSTGLERTQLEVRDGVYFATVNEAGKPTSVALKSIIEDLLKDFSWPKSMRWGATDLTWVRPLRHILCILDEEVIPVEFGHLRAGNITFGHRFLASGEIVMRDPEQYESTLERHCVIADADKRREKIAHDAAVLAVRHGLSVRPDHGLLEEVTGLVEWPVCLLGEFEKDYLSLPPEVLVLEMRHHQKYFALLDDAGKVSHHFLLVSNMKADDEGKRIIAGNARVLRARLEDGRFYWQQDRDKPLSEWAKGLSGMIFHAALGTMAEKVTRLRGLATFLAVFVPHANLKKVERAAELAKADLVSGMVGEFPELQGVMGRYYALEQKEDAEVADAIRDHYKPTGQEDTLPSGAVGLTVALADKFDSLAGLFAAGEKPTGSKDPFALRRAALGCVRMILENALRLPLTLAIDNALSRFPKVLFTERSKEAVTDELREFFLDRLKVMLKEDGVRHDLIHAATVDGDDDLVRVVRRAKALEAFLATDDGANLLAAYNRASNILRKEEKKDDRIYDGALDEDIMQEQAEQALWEMIETLRDAVKSAVKDEDYTLAMSGLAKLRAPVDAFFEHVTVNAADAALRINRLHLLAETRALMDAVADFGRIEG